jgi:hypothetical protein
MCPPLIRLVYQEPSHPCNFHSSYQLVTCGLATTPSPSGFRVITAGTWVGVINPSPCCNLVLVRSVSSSMVKVRGIKLGHVPVPAGTLPHIPGYFTLPLQGPHIDWEHLKSAGRRNRRYSLRAGSSDVLSNVLLDPGQVWYRTGVRSMRMREAGQRPTTNDWPSEPRSSEREISRNKRERKSVTCNVYV